MHLKKKNKNILIFLLLVVMILSISILTVTLKVYTFKGLRHGVEECILHDPNCSFADFIPRLMIRLDYKQTES